MRDEEPLQDRCARRELGCKPDANAAEQLADLLVVLQRFPPLLVPLQDSACKRQPKHGSQQTHADDPVQLARRPIAAGHEHAKGMKQQCYRHQVCHPEVQIAYEVTEPRRCDDVLDALARLGWFTVIELREIDAGCYENCDAKGRDAPQCVEDAVCVSRYRVGEVLKPESLIDPVPRSFGRGGSPCLRACHSLVPRFWNRILDVY